MGNECRLLFVVVWWEKEGKHKDSENSRISDISFFHFGIAWNETYCQLLHASFTNINHKLIFTIVF